MKPRSDGPRRALLAMSYTVGLLSTAFGVLVLLDARAARTTDVGAITSGLEAVVGLAAAVIGAAVLLLSGVADFSSSRRRVIPEPDAPRPEPRAARSDFPRRGEPLDANNGFHDVTKTSPNHYE